MLKPLGDRVIIRLLEKEEITKSGILIPDTAKEKPQEGEVVAVGAGKVYDNGQRVALEVQAGHKPSSPNYADTDKKKKKKKHINITKHENLEGE